MESFDFDNGLSPFVEQELNKVVRDAQFNKSSLDIFSHLTTFADYDKSEYMATLSDTQNNQQNLSQPENINILNYREHGKNSIFRLYSFAVTNSNFLRILKS